MNLKPLLQPIGLSALLLAPLIGLRVADVHGEHENPNQAFGPDASYRLDGAYIQNNNTQLRVDGTLHFKSSSRAKSPSRRFPNTI